MAFNCFLHGYGESGDDLEKVKVNGLPKLIEQRKKFPFIIVSPQAADAEIVFHPELLKGLLSDGKKKYCVDEEHVYLTGLSITGFSTWDFVEKHREEFAAIAPICSAGPIDKLWKLWHMPLWCFHGVKDDAVPIAGSNEMVDSIKKS
jgi:predicted peptidase